MERNNTISLCMIVKNEEKNLGQCLESVHNYVDEIIIVDTGSTDRTKDIATNYEALILEECWRDNFSEVRNKSIEYANGDWILFLDADEKLPPKTAKNLEKLACKKEVTAWLFNIISPISSSTGGPVNRHLNLRMFRNKKEYQFNGRIHEQIKSSIIKENSEAVIKNSKLEIIHYGYYQNKPDRKNKTLRNIRLLQKELNDNSDDPFTHYNLGNSYFMLNKHEKALNNYQLALENMNLNDGYVPILYRNYCICLIELGYYFQGIKKIDEGIMKFPDYTDLYFLKGQLFWETGLIEEAKKAFNQCLQFVKTPDKYTTTEGVADFLAYENLAEIFAKKGDYEKAFEYIKLAFNENSDYKLIYKGVLFLKRTEICGENIFKCLKDEFNLSDIETIEILYDLGEFKVCLNHVEQNLDNQNLLMIRAKSLMKLECYSKAEKLLRIFLEEYGELEEGLKNLCICRWLNFPRKEIDMYITKLKKFGREKYLAYKFINDIIFNKNNNEVHIESFFKREHIQLESTEKKNVIKQIRNIVVKILDLNDVDLALEICNFLPDKERALDRYLILGKLALNSGYFKKAKKLLERSLYSVYPSKDRYYLIGKASEGLQLYDEAFNNYLEVNREQPENELYAASALKGLLMQFVKLINSFDLGIKHSNILQQKLIKYNSLIKKISNIQEGYQDE